MHGFYFQRIRLSFPVVRIRAHMVASVNHAIPHRAVNRMTNI